MNNTVSVKLKLLKLITLVSVLSCSLSIEAEESKYNLAFDESFIGYISDRLALQLVRKEHLEPELNLSKDESGFRKMHLRDARMNYRSKLISCDGPLKELSTHLKDFEFYYEEFYKNDKFTTGVLYFVGNKESEIWPIIEKWNDKVSDEIMKTHHTSFKILPDCIVDGYELKVVR